MKVVRILLGENFLLVQRIQLAGGVNRSGGDETAAKDDDHERSEQDN